MSWGTYWPDENRDHHYTIQDYYSSDEEPRYNEPEYAKPYKHLCSTFQVLAPALSTPTAHVKQAQHNDRHVRYKNDVL